MFNKYLTITFLLLISSESYSQRAETIRTGRPGQSIGANVVGTDVFQLQSGLELNVVEASSNTTNIINNNVVRFGLNEKIEVSGVFDLARNNKSLSGIDNLQIGGRYNIIEKSNGLLPALCFQGRLRLKGFDDYKRADTRPLLVVSAVHSLGEVSSLTTNLTMSYDGFNPRAIYGYTIAYGISLSEKWGAFLEEYASYQNDNWSHAIDGGFSYLYNNNTQYDLAFGTDIEENLSQVYLSFGISWRTF
ncbi:MAG: transporter [Bacteriovoracaceae bacterium]|nr:transporter [Bacteriovoracaceae bacterium]